jgi:hypothetical protein
MKRALLVTVVALLFPTVLNALVTMGVFFTPWPGRLSAYPPSFEYFDAYLYLHNADLSVTAVEYQLLTPADPMHAMFLITEVSYPELMSVYLGDPWSGHSITYWPYLNGYSPGYNLLCKYECFMLDPCWDEGGGMADYPIIIGPHPDSGFLRGTFYPGNDTFPIIGLTSIVCPMVIAAEESSWGAIKGQFR